MFRTQAELDEAQRVGTVAPKDAVVIQLLPQTDEEVEALFKGEAVRGIEFTGKADLTQAQLDKLNAGELIDQDKPANEPGFFGKHFK